MAGPVDPQQIPPGYVADAALGRGPSASFIVHVKSRSRTSRCRSRLALRAEDRLSGNPIAFGFPHAGPSCSGVRLAASSGRAVVSPVAADRCLRGGTIAAHPGLRCAGGPGVARTRRSSEDRWNRFLLPGPLEPRRTRRTLARGLDPCAEAHRASTAARDGRVRILWGRVPGCHRGVL